MLCDRTHARQIADLVIRPDCPAVDDEPSGNTRELRHDLLRDRDGRVLGVADAKEHLVVRVVLLAERPEILVQSRFETTEGFQNRDWTVITWLGNNASLVGEYPDGGKHDVENGKQRRASKEYL